MSMNFNLKSITSKNLTKKQINLICKLKDQKWKYGKKSQKEWFIKNIKRNDVHNLLYIGSKMIGYTLLRKRTYSSGQAKISKYLLFDTLIINQKYRAKKLSSLMMNFNNIVIKNSGYFSFLVCKKELINFYKKYDWKKLDNKKFILKDHFNSSYGMIFNQKKINKKKYNFFFNL